MVATLKTHELMLETDTASSQVKSMYDVFVNGNINDEEMEKKSFNNRGKNKCKVLSLWIRNGN